MGCGIFTRKAGKLIFHNKIQQSGINFIRFRTSGGSNRSTNKIIIISIGKVTQFGILLSHRDKASNLTHEQTKSKRKRRMEEGRTNNSKRNTKISNHAYKNSEKIQIIFIDKLIINP